ncbi:MAG: hypothetical protein KRP56_02390 [Candidatus Methanogranum gryphiswaldense]|nr:MAG: hypothetical protein KRP56_02390 [Candidatus Methanogranum sp. U3.2.1]
MMAAAFVGVASIKGSDDSDANDTVINEASGTVSYVPGTINVSVGGNVLFTPTINWVAATSVVITVSFYDVDSNYTVTYNSGTGVVTVKGLATCTDSFTINVKATITINGTVVTRDISQNITVNVFAAPVFTSYSNDCYFGQYYSSNIVTVSSLTGSGTYAISVTGLPDGLYILGNTIAGNATWAASASGPYTVNVTVVDTITGAKCSGTIIITTHTYSISGTFVDGTHGNSVSILTDGVSKATVSLDTTNTIVNFSTGAATITIDGLYTDAALTTVFSNYAFSANVLTINGQSTYYVAYTISTGETGVLYVKGSTLSSTISDGSIVYIDQSTTVSSASITFNNISSTISSTNTSVYVDGVLDTVTFSGSSITINVNAIVVGMHTYTVDYTVNGSYAGTFTFYVYVIEDGTSFIIPDPSINITVTS